MFKNAENSLEPGETPSNPRPLTRLQTMCNVLNYRKTWWKWRKHPFTAT